VTLPSFARLASGGREGAHEFLCTGDPAVFQELAERFLGSEIGDLHVRTVELGGDGWS
jgi:hypothetical protein